MPQATVRTPDGKVVTVKVPEGATEEQIKAFVAQQQGMKIPEQQVETQTQDLPEIGSMTDLPESPEGDLLPTGAKIGLGMATTPDPKSRMDIIKKAIPGTKFTNDEDGNTVITLPDGRQAFLNKPGFSMQDFADFTTDVVKFLPAAKFASGGRTLLRKMIRGFAGGAATSLGEDVAAVPQGSRQGLQGAKAAATGAADATAEALLPILAPILRAGRRALPGRTTSIRDSQGNLTREARQALKRAGVEPEQVSDELIDSVIRLSESGVPAQAAGGVAASRRFNVPFTRGQATQDFGQQAAEEELRTRGDIGGDIIRGFDERQNQRLVGATEEIEGQLGGKGRALADDAEGGGRIAGNIRGQAEELDFRIDEAFEEARGRNATLNREGLDMLAESAADVRRGDLPLDEKLTPATLKALDRMEDLTGGDVTSQTLEELDKTRRVLGNLIDTAANPTDRRGVTMLKRRFDKYLDDAFDNALFSGDEEALSKLKEARGLRAEFGRRFQQSRARTRSGRAKPDPGGKVVESILEKDPTDEGVVNMIFGRAKVFNSDNAVKAIRAVRRAADNDPEVNNTLKQLTFRRISQDSINNGKFSAKKFIKAFDRAMKDNPAVMREVFNGEELAAIKDFRDAAARTITPEGATNPSRTAGTLTRMLNRLGVVIGLQRGGIGFGALGGGLGRSIGGVIERQGAKESAEAAVNPQFLLPGRPNAAVVSSTISAVRHGGPEAAQVTVDATRDFLQQQQQQER